MKQKLPSDGKPNDPRAHHHNIETMRRTNWVHSHCQSAPISASDLNRRLHIREQLALKKVAGSANVMVFEAEVGVRV